MDDEDGKKKTKKKTGSKNTVDNKNGKSGKGGFDVPSTSSK